MDGFNPYQHSSLGAATYSSPAVAEAQQLLVQLGYPLAVDGVWGPKTASALTAVWMTLGKLETPGGVDESVLQTLRQAVQNRVKQNAAASLAPPRSTNTSLTELPVQKPWWKAPAFIAAGALGLAAVGYLLWQETQGGLGDGEQVPEPEPVKRRARAKPEPVEKCSRTPPDFEAGELLEG